MQRWWHEEQDKAGFSSDSKSDSQNQPTVLTSQPKPRKRGVIVLLLHSRKTSNNVISPAVSSGYCLKRFSFLDSFSGFISLVFPRVDSCHFQYPFLDTVVIIDCSP
jgi:hypothetical protein